MKLFDEMPHLENDAVILKEITEADADALKALASDPAVYVYLPTFLYEQKYDDIHKVIANMKKECFDTKESIMLGIFLKEDPSRLAGIAEIYAYEEKKNKASVGCRLNRDIWHKGIALQAVSLLKDYLEHDIKIRTITAHIMTHNHASRKMIEKLGFENKFPELWEDWGREGPVLTEKYVYKNTDNPKYWRKR